MGRRRWSCGEADYLTVHGIDPKAALAYDARFSASEVRALVQAGVSPEEADTADVSVFGYPRE